MMDLEDIEEVRAALRFRGAQGTTGTQASFMEIFHNDGAKIDKLNEILCKKAGFDRCYSVSLAQMSLFFLCLSESELRAFHSGGIRISAGRWILRFYALF
jgi:hypothetical protein